MDNCKTVGDVIAFLQTKDPDQDLSTPASHQLFHGTKEWYFGFYVQGELKPKPNSLDRLRNVGEDAPPLFGDPHALRDERCGITEENCGVFSPPKGLRFGGYPVPRKNPFESGLNAQLCGITKRMRESGYISATTPSSSSGKCWIKPVTREDLFGQRTGTPVAMTLSEIEDIRKDQVDHRALSPTAEFLAGKWKGYGPNTFEEYQKPKTLDEGLEEIRKRELGKYYESAGVAPQPTLGDPGHVDENLCASAMHNGATWYNYYDSEADKHWALPVIENHQWDTDLNVTEILTKSPQSMADMLGDEELRPVILSQLTFGLTWGESVKVTDGPYECIVNLGQAKAGVSTETHAPDCVCPSPSMHQPGCAAMLHKYGAEWTPTW
ncbi:MAG: hypothetical protein V3T23_07155 [Nitrososphaerales archaeon]